MTPWLTLLALAHADTGRTHATALVGVDPGGRLLVRGAVHYGLRDRLSLVGELGTRPGLAAVGAGAGVMVHALDSDWWRISGVVLPELVVATDRGAAPARALLGSPVGLSGRAGLQVEWLAFWGLCFVARVDRVAPLDGSGGWWEVSGGLAGRM